MARHSGSDQLGHRTGSARVRAADVEVRPLQSGDEYRACVGLQRETWGADFSEVVPATILKVSQRVGGLAAGAFDETGELLGFVFGLTGLEAGRPAHWSHMLAVREDVRDLGIGRRLKEFQRDFLLPLDVDVIYWTFDPLVARNAHLNLNLLGAEVMEYVADMYGDTASRLHSGLGTDRFIMAWRRDASGSGLPGKGREFAAEPFAAAPVVNTVFAAEAGSFPVELPLPAAGAVRVEIPPDIQAAKAASPEAAAAWRATTRRALSWYLERGYRTAGFYCESGRRRAFYCLFKEGPHTSSTRAGKARAAGACRW